KPTPLPMGRGASEGGVRGALSKIAVDRIEPDSAPAFWWRDRPLPGAARHPLPSGEALWFYRSMSLKMARRLRRSVTVVERLLWRRLRDRQLDGHKFRRQHPLGPYVLDFFCEARKLVIEIDGGQHADQVQHDERRTRWLEERGCRVIRFWNNDVTGNL